MQNFEDFELFGDLACSLQNSLRLTHQFQEHIDEFPEQEGSSGFLAEDPLQAVPMSVEEKIDLIQGVQGLQPQFLKGVCRMISEALQANADNLHLENISTVMLRKIDNYVKRKSHIVLLAAQPGQELY